MDKKVYFQRYYPPVKIPKLCSFVHGTSGQEAAAGVIRTSPHCQHNIQKTYWQKEHNSTWAWLLL